MGEDGREEAGRAADGAAADGAAADGASPLVTLLVVAYNQERYIRAAVAGAFAQTYSPLEIVLSDDCSADRTFEIMAEMAAGYRGPHRVVLNRNPRNLGIPGHVDALMARAQGAFVVMNAGDDVSVPERTARLVEVWRGSGGRVKAVHSAKRRMAEDGTLGDLVPAPVPLDRHHRPLDLLRKPPAIHGASMGWAREIFEVFGPLGPEPLLEDYPICLRAATLGEVAYLDAPLLHYRSGGLSWSEAEKAGHYMLYGHRLRFLKWHLSFSRLYLDDMARVAPPDAEACRAQCERNIRNLSFEIALAEMRHGARLRALPGAIGTSLRHRDAAPVRMALKYLFDRAYMAWVNRRGVITRA
jgi:glycosyltransferase involved in cell wall biosynthesis